jgi:hypothetical protein
MNHIKIIATINNPKTQLLAESLVPVVIIGFILDILVAVKLDSQLLCQLNGHH